MRSSFTDEEIAIYRRTGFLAVPDFLSADELTNWRAVVSAATAGGATDNTGRNSEKVFSQRMHLRRTDSAVAELVDDPAIGRLVADLEGLHAVRLYLDQALAKEPYAAPTQYHADMPWWAFDSRHACTIWIALDDATPDNGCLYFVPGSHRLALRSAGDLGPDLGALFGAHPDAAATPTPTPLPAGGCTFHNGFTVHGAGANMTPGRRRAMTIAFMPDGSRFDGHRDVQTLGEAYLDSLAVGDLLDDNERNPLVFMRS